MAEGGALVRTFGLLSWLLGQDFLLNYHAVDVVLLVVDFHRSVGVFIQIFEGRNNKLPPLLILNSIS